MPRLGKPEGTDGCCPQCGGDLMSIVVLHGGRREHCPTCGFTRIIGPKPPAHPALLEGAEPTGVQDIAHLLLYAKAVLQTVRQVRGCGRCVRCLTLLRAQIDDLEQIHTMYADHPEQCDDERVDAFFVQLTERLQGISTLCSICRRRMERTTWELFVGWLLEVREPEES